MPTSLRYGCALACLLVGCDSDALESDAPSPDECTRPRYGYAEEPLVCEDGLLCHLDSTCVAPGTPDADGVEPLFKDAIEITRSVNGVLGIAGYAVHDGKIYWGDRGTESPNNDQRDAPSLLVFDLATFTNRVVDPRLGGIPRADGDHLYIETNAGIRVRALDALETDVHLIGDSGRPAGASWIVEGGTVYYVADLAIHRWSEVEGDVSFFEAEGAEAILNLAIDGDRLLVEVLMSGDVTQLLAIDREDGTSSVVIESFRNAPDGFLPPFIVAVDHVISADGDASSLQKHDLDSGAQSFIEGTEEVTLAAVHEGQVYFVAKDRDPQEGDKIMLKRVSLNGGTAEVLADSPLSTRPIEIEAVSVHDGYLYWLANSRHLLVRKAL